MKIIDYEHFFKLQRFNEYEKITEKIENCSMKFKFYLFEFIEINENDCKTIKNLLKRLVERNIEIIYDKIFCYCMTNPFAVIESFIQNVIFSETLSKLLIKIISMMPKLFKEMFYYYMLKRFIAYKKIINGNSHDRTFISMCNLLSSFKTIDPQPLMLYITKKFISKNYLYIPLIEKVIDDNTKISDKLKETLERAHVEIFKYHKIDRKLKIEIAGRYYKFYNKFYKRKIINKTFMIYDDLKVCIQKK
ncbi:hypothetical protein COBT_002440 [Conglomerata obtusa]